MLPRASRAASKKVKTPKKKKATPKTINAAPNSVAEKAELVVGQSVWGASVAHAMVQTPLAMLRDGGLRWRLVLLCLQSVPRRSPGRLLDKQRYTYFAVHSTTTLCRFIGADRSGPLVPCSR